MKQTSPSHKPHVSAGRLAIGIISIILAAMISEPSWGAQITAIVNGQQTIVDSPVRFAEDPTGTGLVQFDVDSGQTFMLSESGEPQIPYETITLLLPPNADPATATSRLVFAEYESAGTGWTIDPVPPMATRDSDGNEIIVWPDNKTIVGGQDINIYTVNAFWPTEAATITSTGRLRQWNLAEIAVPLVRWNPVSSELQLLVAADVEVVYDTRGNAALENVSAHKGRALRRDRVKQMAVNFQQNAAAYEPADDGTLSPFGQEEATLEIAPAAPNLNHTGFVIITTNAIRDASTKLDDFVAHKQAAHYVVSTITEDDYGTGTGDAAANNIRAWLQANYTNEAYGSGGILYVLLIGDPRTNSSSVPMKMVVLNDGTSIPTDYFYAELTGDYQWNALGSINKYFEVYVGRIPYYGNIAHTDAILQKTMDYENATQTTWRRHVFLPMVPLDAATPGYQLGEQIKYNLLEPKGILSSRLYRNGYGWVAADYSLPVPPEYSATFYPANVWSREQYGIVVWLTHGYALAAERIINTSQTANLNDAYPSAVFQGSCDNGWPENATNLGYSILRNGGIGTVSATRHGWYYSGESNYTNATSAGGLGYQFARRLSERKTLGQAVWDTKEAMNVWLKNYLVFNLYGDPSVRVLSTFEVTPIFDSYIYINADDITQPETTYLISNRGSTSVNWTAQSDVDWLQLNPTQGAIDGGGSASVSVQLTAGAASMTAGTHKATVTISNTATGQVENRTIQLVIQPRALQGHWKLDETAGITAHDSTYNHRHGTLKGDNTFGAGSTAGQFGNALTFDGIDDSVQIPALNLYSDKVTISAWVKRDGPQANQAGIFFSRAGSTVAGINLRSNGELRYHWNDTPSSYTWPTGLITPDGQWAFVALVVEPDKATMYLYANGTLSSTFQNITHAIEEFNGVAYIGRDSLLSRYFKGHIDDVRIYNQALTSSEINALILGGPAETPLPYDNTVDVPLITTLQWSMGSAAVANDVYLGTDYDTVALATTASDVYQGRFADPMYHPLQLEQLTEYFWRIDQVDSDGYVIAGHVWSFSTGIYRGVLREVWLNIPGNLVSALTGDPRFPDDPDGVELVDAFEGPRNWDDAYGSRLHGFIIPPETGQYTFWIASDDNSELWLSPSTNPDNAIRIAHVTGDPAWTGYRQWDKYDSQQSNTFQLHGGRAYYICALHKEGAGGDHISVAWQGPSISHQVIDGQYLIPYNSDMDWSPYFVKYPIGVDVLEGYDYVKDISDKAVGFDGHSLTFTKLDGPDWLSLSANGVLSGVARDGDTGLNTFTIQVQDSQYRTGQATLEVEVWNTFTGEKGLEDLIGLAARWLDSDCDDFPPCGGADLTGSRAVDIWDLAVMSSKWLNE